MHKRLIALASAAAMILAVMGAGGQETVAARDLTDQKTVIHHTAAFAGELTLLRQQMTNEYGDPDVIGGDLGREYLVWETGDKTRVVASLTRVGMENATLSSSMILNLAEDAVVPPGLTTRPSNPSRPNTPKPHEQRSLYPDIVTHGGICGNVYEEGYILDVYAVSATAFSTYALYGADGPEPRGKPTWIPEDGSEARIQWMMTDPVLTELVSSGFHDAIENPDFQTIWEASGIANPPSLHENYVQISSNYFVANDDFNYELSQQFRIDPDDRDDLDELIYGEYDGQVHEVGCLDMETAAVVWTFRQHGIPVAVLRYPSDLARSDATDEISNFGATASALGGYTFFYGLQRVIEAVESSEVEVLDGRVVR